MGKKVSKNVYISHLKCPECGLDFPIPRFNSSKRKVDHIKDIYCPRCKKIQKMIEKGNI